MCAPSGWSICSCQIFLGCFRYKYTHLKIQIWIVLTGAPYCRSIYSDCLIEYKYRHNLWMNSPLAISIFFLCWATILIIAVILSILLFLYILGHCIEYWLHPCLLLFCCGHIKRMFLTFPYYTTMENLGQNNTLWLLYVCVDH